MASLVDGLQATVCDLSINLCRANAGVTEQFLQSSNLGSTCEHVSRKAVTQSVRTDFAAATDSSSEWQAIHGGQAFNVVGNSSFELQVTEVADYICSFL